MKIKKRGVSPVIATVLLIVMVIVIAILIWLWARTFIQEVIQKQGRPADQVCGDINLELSLNDAGDTLYVVNRGNIPIYGLEIRKSEGGNVELQEEKEVGIGPGQSGSYDLGDDAPYDEVEVVPVILGEVKDRREEFVCDKYAQKVE